MCIKEVVSKIHTKGNFEYDPLRYVNSSVSTVCAFTCDRDVFPTCLDHILSEVKEDKWALLYCLPKKLLEKGLKLLHTDNDVHSFFEATKSNGYIHLYMAHKQQNLGKYYYKNMVWEEEDIGLCCSSSTPFSTRDKRKISNNTMTKKGSHKGKEKAFEDEGMCSKGNKAIVTNYKRTMVNGKAKMVEEFGNVKTRRDICGVIRDLRVNNVEGNAEVGSKQGVGSTKMHGSTVKVLSLNDGVVCLSTGIVSSSLEAFGNM
ncbi:hypothetical protein Tco_1173480 [Tanacetum coccineum]